jgi:hypothetical protein
MWQLGKGLNLRLLLHVFRRRPYGVSSDYFRPSHGGIDKEPDSEAERSDRDTPGHESRDEQLSDSESSHVTHT